MPYPVASVRGHGTLTLAGGGGSDAVHVSGVEWNQSTDTWTVLVAADLERTQGVEFNQSTDTWTTLAEDDLVLAEGVRWDAGNDTWATLSQGIEE